MNTRGKMPYKLYKIQIMDKAKKNPVGRPPSGKIPKTSAEVGTKPGETRKTYIVEIEKAEKIDAIAYWDRVPVKKVLGDALDDRIKKYEKKNGPVKPKPKQ